MSRRFFVLFSGGLFFAGLWILGADPRDLLPSAGGRQIAGDFFAAAFRPAFDYQDVAMRGGEVSFLAKVCGSFWLTVRYALVAMSLAIVLGIMGGILGSRSWWPRSSWALEWLRRVVRLLMTGIRSVHELMWALLFLSAVGTSPLAAVFALALPYGGTLGKVFSELLDEAHSSAKDVMRFTGGSSASVFLAGVLPQALPDLITYALYRLECAIRSSAVLGFVGVPTLGYQISTAYEDGHFCEIWTYLYVLFAMVIFFEWWGGRVRKLMVQGKVPLRVTSSSDSMAMLWEHRGWSFFLRGSAISMSVLVLFAWTIGGDWTSGVSFEQRLENLQRFSRELIPYPLRESGEWSVFWQWGRELLIWDGLDAGWRTLNLGTCAGLLAGFGAMIGMVFGAKTLASSRPRGVDLRDGMGRAILGAGVRMAAVFGRAIPEFILAFLLLQVFGPTPWALILALAIHNGGILLRLGSEVLDNQQSRTPELLLLQGGGRMEAYLAGLLPQSFNRLVLFLFYRWETCIREATMLGMLGVGSLGFLISEAGVRFYYDEMLLWVICGGGLVFCGDLASDWVRSRLAEPRAIEVG